MGNSETLFISFDEEVLHVITQRDFQNFIYLMSLMTIS